MTDILHSLPTQRTLTLACALGLVFGLAACDGNDSINDPIQDPSNTILQNLTLSDGTSTFIEAVTTAGLQSTLSGAGPITVFVVANDGFGGVDDEALLGAGDALGNVLRYHVVQGAVTYEQLAEDADGELQTLLGQPLSIDVNADEVFINGARVLRSSDQNANGIYHVISRPVFPDLLTQARYLEETSAAFGLIEAAGLVDEIQNAPADVTIFTPTNDALDELGEENVEALAANPALLVKVLTYHVVPQEIKTFDLAEGTIAASTLAGAEVSLTADVDTTVEIPGAQKYVVTLDVNGVPVSGADYQTATGVMHLLDGVLLENLTVVERASISPQTDDLADAIVAAGLDAQLQGTGPFTIFAPTDDAFADIDAEDLAADPGVLARLLRAHIVADEITADEITDGMTVTTLEGNTLTFTVDEDENVFVNDVQIATADLDASNGVIHLVGEVLAQEVLNVVERIMVHSDTDSLQFAVEEANLAAVLEGNGPFTIFAPADDAANIDTLMTLARSGNEGALRRLLQYHVVADEITSEEITDGATAQTINGGTLEFDIDGENIFVVGAENRAEVTTVDLEASNGVIHLVDTVLLPPDGLSIGL